ncbi:MAG: carboxylating nicotinate-nucleotide diphosphorylase [Pseudomonadales bacterium]|nr:carboxylating nicotinate-nucleotide diphosphorylase [Pseudomonadales bacterium]
MQNHPLLEGLEASVRAALMEDIGSGDITAELIPADTTARAQVICREAAVVCGQPWVQEVFRQIDSATRLDWHRRDGAAIEANELVFTVSGKARSLLTAERTALNFLQTLSAVATRAREYAGLIQHTRARILDTRKTLPGLRRAQKYAVLQGGCLNHRLGLYDAFLIKENHIRACGGIAAAISAARSLHPDRPVEVEVENLEQLEEALTNGTDTVMLDNFSLEELHKALALNAGRAQLEASGGYDRHSIVAVAEAGVDFISVGALTKHCRAIDFSMLFI